MAQKHYWTRSIHHRPRLAMTYALIRMLPEQCQAISNCEDMGVLLRHICGPDWMVEVRLDRHPLSEDEWPKAVGQLGSQEYEADETLSAASHDFGSKPMGAH
jgi:hypothetical protein